MTKRSEWAERVSSWHASGLTAKEFARGRDYDARSLLWWGSFLRRKDPKLVRVVVEPSKIPRTFVANRDSAIEVRVGRSHLVVRSGFDAQLLREVVAALEPK